VWGVGARKGKWEKERKEGAMGGGTKIRSERGGGWDASTREATYGGREGRR